MPIEFTWDGPDHTILLEIIKGSYTLEDYRGMVDEAAHRLSREEHIVHIIADFRNAAPPPLNALTGALYAEKRMPPNQGIVVYVGVGALLQSFINVTQKADLKIARHLYTARSIEEARRIIAEKRADLDAPR